MEGRVNMRMREKDIVTHIQYADLVKGTASCASRLEGGGTITQMGPKS